MAPNRTTRPNLVSYVVDQLSAKWLEAAQSGICPTPNVDRLLELIVVQDSPRSRRELCAGRLLSEQEEHRTPRQMPGVY